MTNRAHRRWTCFLSLLLAGVFVSASPVQAAAEEAAESGGSEASSYYSPKEHADVDYEEMTYTGVNAQALDEILAELDGITDGSIAVDDPEQRTADIYDEILQIMNKEYTEYVLGDIAHYRYVNDEELAEKNKQDTLAIQDMSDMAYVSLQKALLGPYGGTLSEAFSDEQLDELEEYEALTDRERELIDQETELQQEYDRLSEEEYSFEYEGKTWTMDDLYTDTPEDQEDIAEIYLGITKEMNDAIVPVFQEMISTRKEIAEAEGYDTYTDYCYDVNYGRDFTGEDIAALRQTIKEELKPLYDQLTMMQYMNEYNTDLDEPMTGEEIVDTLAERIGNVHPELSEAFEYLREHKLYCIDSDEDMVDVGFTSDLPEYGSAFIFDKTDGTIHDLETVVHEFGHFNAAYHARQNVLTDSLLVDVAEIQSQGLEMLFMDEMKEILPDDPEGLELYLVLNMLDSVLTGFEYDEFQQEIYAGDDMTQEELNRLAMDVDNKYTQLFFDDNGEAYEWVMINHTFTSPLYYIGYATSALSALDIWSQSLEDRDDAVDKYMKLSAVPPDMPYQEATTSCGLRNMLEPESIRELADEIRDWAGLDMLGGFGGFDFPDFGMPYEFGEDGTFGWEDPMTPVQPYENGTVPYEYEPVPNETVPYETAPDETAPDETAPYAEDPYAQDLSEEVSRQAFRAAAIATAVSFFSRLVILIIALIAFFRKKKKNQDRGGWNGPSGGNWNGPSGGNWNEPSGGYWDDQGPDGWR